MKKLFLLAAMLAAVLSGGSAGAQNSVITQRNDMAYNIISTLVCEYHHPQTIACFNTRDFRSVFVIARQDLTTVGIEIEGYYINDMAINDDKDSLFFCGHSISNNQKGIVGCFKIQDLFYGTGNIHIQDYFYAEDFSHYVMDFTRMLYYHKSDGKPYLACIGCTINGYPCLVDRSTCSTGSYLSGHVNNKNEKFTDIKVVSYMGLYGSYLMTAGTESSNGVYISLRYYDMDTVISTPGCQDYINTFCVNSSDMREWLDKDVLLTPIKDNKISTVSYRSGKELQPKYPMDIHVAYYGLGALINPPHLFSMVKSIEIPYINDGDSAILHRYINQRTTEKTVFLQTAHKTGSPTSTFCEIDYPTLGTTGTVDFYGDSDTRLQGLSEYYGTVRYVMSGYSESLNSKLMYEVETFGNASSCVGNETQKYEDVEPMASIREVNGFDVIGGINTMNPISHRKRDAPLIIDCTRMEEQE